MKPSTPLAIAIALGTLAGLGAVDVARAQMPVHGRPTTESEPAPVPKELLEAVTITERLRATVPAELEFRDQDNRPTTLGKVLAGDLPTLLTFNYSTCPSFCSAQLNGLTESLAKSRYALGKQYRLITIVLAPDEAAPDAARTRTRYLERLASLRAKQPELPAGDPRGWTFLVANTPDDERAIRAAADAVGFGYRYIPTQREYAHPAAAIALSPRGTVTRYVHGVAPSADELDETLLRAGLAEPSSATGFVLACLHWDPAANSNRWGRSVLRITVLAFLAIGAIVAGVLVVRRRRPPGVNPS